MTTETNVKYVEIYHDESNSDQPWRWRAIAGNGEEVSQGESHGSASDAMRAAQGVFGEDVLIVHEPPPSSAAIPSDDWVDEDSDQTEGVDA